MTGQEKIDLVVSAILEARKEYPAACIKLELTEENHLKDLGKNETLRVLQKLEHNERIVRLYNSNPDSLPSGTVVGGRWEYDKKRGAKFFVPWDADNTLPEIVVEDHSITFRLLDNFDSWHSIYMLKKATNLENLSLFNLEKIYNLVHDIQEKFEINPNRQLTIELKSSSIKEFPLLIEKWKLGVNLLLYREEALEYLKEHNIISSYAIKSYEDVESDINMMLNIDEFNNFKKEIAKIYEEKSNQQKHQTPAPEKPQTDTKILQEPLKKPQNEIIYEIKYTSAREILLNSFLLTKTNFDSENDNVFDYIYRNPNRKIKLEELKKEMGSNLTKSLHKIVENLGFRGELKKAFFSISKNDLLFRNPLTQKNLDDLGISRLKFPK